MEQARKKIQSIKRKLFSIQKKVLDIKYSNGITDYNDPRIKSMVDEIFILETVMDGWIAKYREESQLFWKS